MSGALLRLTQRYVNRRIFQSTLFVAGIALGVAVGVAIDLANTSASRAFSLSVSSVTGRATHQIIGSSGTVPTEVYTQLRRLGMRNSAPVIEALVQATSLDNRSLRLLGIDPLAEAPFRNYLSPSPDADIATYQSSLYVFITRPKTALISHTLATRFALQPGDRLALRTPTQTAAEVEVVGLLYPNDDVSESALNNLIITDIATAQELAGIPGQITRIDLLLPDGFDLAALESLLPDGVLLTPSSARQDALSQMTDAFELNLQALSLLALLVGVFLIYNTVTFSVVQRRPVIGILRSLGTTRWQIFVLILAEAAILGTLGTLLGLGLGVVLGQGAVRLVAQTINDLYFRVSVEGGAITPFTLLKGTAIGIATSLIAALIPSYEATRTPPAGVMRRSTAEQNTWRLLPYVAIGAVALMIAGLFLLQIPTTNLILSFAALFLILVGCALLTPLALIAAMILVTPVTGRLFGVLGRMAPRAIVRTLSRTSIAVTALPLAVSVIVGVSGMIDSFSSTLVNWLQLTLGADIFISPFDDNAGSFEMLIDPAIIARLEAIEGVEAVATARSVSVLAPDYPNLPPVNLVSVNRDISNGQRRFAWLDAPEDDFWQALQAGKVIVSEPFAYRRAITPQNNSIALLTSQGEQIFAVAGVYYDYTSDQGTLMMHADTYHRFFDDPYVTALALELLPNADLEAVLNTLQSDTLVGTGLEAQSNRDLRAGVMRIFDRTFSITVALRLLATIVAFIGILSALMALQIEHIRQYGIMRANGMTPGQLRLFTFIQTGLIGSTAGLLAAPIGTVLALILVRVINVRSFGWSIDLSLNWVVFVQAFFVALAAALAAGIYPAWRLGRLVTAEALRSE